MMMMRVGVMDRSYGFAQVEIMWRRPRLDPLGIIRLGLCLLCVHCFCLHFELRLFQSYFRRILSPIDHLPILPFINCFMHGHILLQAFLVLI